MAILEHKPLRDVVADELRRMIVSGEIAAGERLIEDKLAELLGVSRNPVREAIRSLEATGLVEVVPRRGAYATAVTIDDLWKLQELRTVLEDWVITAAAERATEEDLLRIDERLESGRAASAAGDAVRAAEMHREFHVAIEQATHNPYTGLVLAPLRQRTDMVFTMLFEDRGDNAWDEHAAIRDAIAAKDTELARRLIKDHIESSVSDYALARTPPPPGTETP